jgi:large subunit ribosomal protein L21
MYAVIQTGGKQYKVGCGDVLDVERLSTGVNEVHEFDDVLAVSDGDNVRFGAPRVEGAVVRAEVVEHRRGKKLIAFKMKRRKGSRRTIGHRQELSRVRILEINSA